MTVIYLYLHNGVHYGKPVHMVMDIGACIYRDVQSEEQIPFICKINAYGGVNVSDKFRLYVKKKSKDYMPRARPFTLTQSL